MDFQGDLLFIYIYIEKMNFQGEFHLLNKCRVTFKLDLRVYIFK